LVTTTREAALKWVRPSTDLDLARTAMGADQAMIARANAKPTAKGPGLAR
jgi:hypothetical protein